MPAPLFTRRHYEAIAALPLDPRDHVLLSRLFAEDNPRFDVVRYLEATPDSRRVIVPLPHHDVRRAGMLFDFADYIVWSQDTFRNLYHGGLDEEYVTVYNDGDLVPVFTLGSKATVPGWPNDWWYFSPSEFEIAYPYEDKDN